MPANRDTNPPDTSQPPIYRHRIALRVRYSETDQMGTVYNARHLDWFECGRSELLRSMGMPYRSLEEKGVFLPLVEAHVEYQGRAQYDDLLVVTTDLFLEGRARLRCAVQITQHDGGRPVAQGYTIHAFTDRTGRAMRPPTWIMAVLQELRNRPTPPSSVDVITISPQIVREPDHAL